MEFIKLGKKDYLIYFPDTYNFFKINQFAYNIFSSIINQDINFEEKFQKTDIRQCLDILQKKYSFT
ncbi:MULTISPECIES: hypothetical protein [unclassified Treponema]|uniref:hypothetical protein n=1 Tax=unclassified Treponema TaxID=2638727 RepID=UPI0020A3F5CF|nr:MULTISPECIES: hypothetical protein [unclassified Treponema]UTC66946.1 hypothetical protein E4O06_13540 [Treponema sp. OMZ 789]UTC69675.1 hypothetical protein E4O01_13680 [Treponema sp. OMZ 790]UTC72389.1 hypothetical protein E4O02_13770 [Treponema sp. OMZ 791]